MRNNIKESVLKEADYIINTKNTIREASKFFNVSKSTIHKDLNERLKYINKEKYAQVYEIMIQHINVRHINGGNATKNKYKINNKCKM